MALSTVDIQEPTKDLYHAHAKEISGMETDSSSEDNVFGNLKNDNLDMSRMGKEQVLRVSSDMKCQLL